MTEESIFTKSSLPKQSDLQTISATQAREKIMAGEKLQGVVVEFLDLSGITLSQPILLESSYVQGMDLRGSKIEGKVVIDNCKVTGLFACGTNSVFDKSARATFCDRVSFNHSVFTDKVHLGGVTFQGPVFMRATEFEDIVNFHSAVFKGQVYFWGTKFWSVMVGNHSVFEGELHASQVHFADTVKFEAGEFGGETNFHRGVFQGYASFYGANFLKQVVFSEASLERVRMAEVRFHAGGNFDKTHFGNEVDLKKACFEEDVQFTNTVFDKKVSFKDAVFRKKASFLYSRFFGLSSFLSACFEGEVSFLNAQFHDEALFNFDQNTQKSWQLQAEQMAAIFKRSVDFTNVRFHRRAVFDNVVFEGRAAVAGVYFGEHASFYCAHFHGEACFEGISCSQEIDLGNARFSQKLSLDNANINRRLNLLGAWFPEICFYGAAIDIMMVERFQLVGKMSYELEKPQFDRAEKEYILLKESFGKLGMQEEEDWAYRRKKAMERKFVSSLAKDSLRGREASSRPLPGKLASLGILIKNLFAWLVIDKGSGYGTQPMRITLLAFALIFGFAAFYAANPDELFRPDRGTFQAGQAVYFSFATFTTMGFGDIQPQPGSYMKYVVAMEAFLGIFVMTLFVGTYTRKIIR